MSDLFGELFFTQLVQRVELARQDDVVYEADRRQFNPDNDLSVGNHHGDRPEVDLQVLWKLLSSRVSGVLLPRKQNVSRMRSRVVKGEEVWSRP